MNQQHDIPGIKKTKDVIQEQLRLMKESKKTKYEQMTEELKSSIDWQDLLKQNLMN